jgi:hypothetical protein
MIPKQARGKHKICYDVLALQSGDFQKPIECRNFPLNSLLPTQQTKIKFSISF